MQLVWFEVCGYRRFYDLAKLNVDGKLVAIVGPNEAGKTSLLEAIQHFNHENGFQRDGASQEITRGKPVDDEQSISELTFAIDDEDRQVLSEIPEASNIRWFSLKKSINGEITAGLSPKPKRNFSLRHGIKTDILKVLETQTPPSLEELVVENSAEEDDLRIEVSNLLEVLESDSESFLSSQISTIQMVIDEMESLNAITESVLLTTLINKLRRLKDYEELRHPAERAKSILMERRPQFLLFDDEDRNLESLYDLNSFFRAQNPVSIPSALQNLANAGQLDLSDLHDARSKQDAGRIETILENANERLIALMQDAWTQAKISVKLRLDSWQLHVLLKSQKGQFDRVADRSDGLRQFVALLLFLSQEPARRNKPIVLIDEAERHLHYDAQADLVQMFARQELASKIIYTTHSIGCLPEDLGSGVRMVETEDAYSKIENWFWESDRPGFSSLLFGMGANTLAFIPIRYAVIAEGAADMLLLPAMLKEALNKEFLDFQVVPGLSKSSSGQLPILDNEASRTVYLTDNDGSGRDLKSQLHSAGIPEARIISLISVNGEDVVLEDYLDLNSYVYAINEELRRSHGDNYQIEPAQMNVPNRPYVLEQWCEAKGLKPPSKRAVAYRLLEARHDKPLVDEECVSKASQLYNNIRLVLKSQDDN